MKILIIEDDRDIRMSIELVLKEAGYLTDSVDNGAEGLYRASNWEYDAIILDVMLPEMDGWAVLKRLRDRNETPVIFLTALGRLDDRIRGLDGGADDFIVKPFEPEELLARVRAVMRRSRGRRDNQIDLGSVQIDLESMVVTRDGKRVSLKPAEFRILVYLAQRQGRVLPAAQIIDGISMGEYESDASVLKVQIYQLRKKLGRDLIENRRHLGYTISRI